MSVRVATLQKAVAVMEAALRFYRDGNWNDDYPGGIEVGPDADGRYLLDMGGRADRALRDASVKRAVADLTAASKTLKENQ